MYVLSPKLFPPFRFSDYNFLCISHVTHMSYMPCLSHLPQSDHPNYIWWRVQIMKLLITQLSPFILIIPFSWVQIFSAALESLKEHTNRWYILQLVCNKTDLLDNNLKKTKTALKVWGMWKMPSASGGGVEKKVKTSTIHCTHTLQELMHLHDWCKSLQARYVKEQVPWQHLLSSHICWLPMVQLPPWWQHLLLHAN